MLLYQDGTKRGLRHSKNVVSSSEFNLVEPEVNQEAISTIRMIFPTNIGRNSENEVGKSKMKLETFPT